MSFNLRSDYVPCGDQPQAIAKLSKGVLQGKKHQVLMGVTGSGKTFTMANVIQNVQKPTLVLAPNKTLAAQLYGEFKELFPNNAVEYFVSYYDYYQPEAYIPHSDIYIEKDTSINEEIDRLRHATTSSLLKQRDVIVVASVSCIYGLGSPKEYAEMLVLVKDRAQIPRDKLLARLVEIQYERNDYDFHRGTFRVRGDVVEIFPAYEEDRAIRLEFFGDMVECINEVDPIRGKVLRPLKHVHIYPNSHYVTTSNTMQRAIEAIKEELKERIAFFESQNKLLEAQRIRERTLFDLAMMKEMGYCTGIENYSRHLDGRKPGEPPYVLLNYFPADFLVIIDESHIAIPQLNGMYHGDRSRKQTLVEFGFRLPSALDNRPLTFEEFEKLVKQVVYVSATPAEYELTKSGGKVVEQIIRPTGLMDPAIEVKAAAGQVDDLLEELRKQVARKERTLVTTLTKRMAEDLTEHYAELGIKVRYLHSEINTLERIEILRDLRLGKFDVLIGINLLREGLDLPEVSLVAVLDADKEGFLRSERSLIQICGRTARNIGGRVILYGDVLTRSIKATINETKRRRKIQDTFNREHNITPESIKKAVPQIIASIAERDYVTIPLAAEPALPYVAKKEVPKLLKKLHREMINAAQKLEFERAAEIRDRIHDLEQAELKYS